MNELMIYKSKFYMSNYRAERYNKMVEYTKQVDIIRKEMTDDFGLLFENGKILVVYFDEQRE